MIRSSFFIHPFAHSLEGIDVLVVEISTALYSHEIFLRLEPLDPEEDSEMELFDRWTKIQRWSPSTVG